MLVVFGARTDGNAEGEAVASNFGEVNCTAKNIAAPLAIRITNTASAPTRFLALSWNDGAEERKFRERALRKADRTS